MFLIRYKVAFGRKIVEAGVLITTFIFGSLLLAACGEASTATNVPPGQPLATSATTPLAAQPTIGGGLAASVQLAGFAPYQVAAPDVKANVPSYSFEAAGLPANDQTMLQSLNAAQQALLAQNGFAVSLDGSKNNQFYDLYQRLKDHSSNVFVSSDAVLHVYHILYDYSLRLIEANNFVADLKSLSGAMQKVAQTQSDTATGEVKTAAQHNLAFFSVAASLLDPAAAVPASVQSQVAAELKLIEAHAGIAVSPIFGSKLDYSQYVPRGHYTRSEDLQHYFKAMMWYGQVTLHLQAQQGPEVGRAETRSALLMLLAMSDPGQASAKQQWQRIYETTSFMVGSSDDLNLADYTQVASHIYPGGLSLPALTDTTKLDSFITAASKLPAPKINGEVVSDSQNVAQVTRGFRFMGQRFIPDGYIMGQLMYNKVGDQSNPRFLAMGLDVPAVFGSTRAADILTQTYQQDKYAHYTEQQAALKTEFANQPTSQWSANLYWGWLYSLKALLDPTGNGYPAFMQKQAWTDKSLNSFLGSWTELRHDTILYAKQPVGVAASAIRPQPDVTPVGYLEPNPNLYARLEALTKQTTDGLQSRQLLDPELKIKLESFQAMLHRFGAISQQELSNQNLSAADNSYLLAIGGTLETQSSFSSSINNQVSSQTDKSIELVADVATDPNKQQVQEEAIGTVLPVYVIVPVNGQPRLLQGGVFSYYEFQQPLSNRLTDEAWQGLSKRPALPIWTASFAK